MRQFTGNSKFGDGTNNSEFKPDGELNQEGTARIKRFIQMPAGASKAPGANPATFTTLGLDGAWAFAKTITEQISMAIAIPNNMEKSVAPVFRIGWSSPAVTGTVKWQLEYLWRGLEEDASETTPDGTVVVVETVGGTANDYSITTFEVVAPSETDRICQFRLSRVGGDDTADDVACFIGLVFEYTSNKLGEAL